MHKENPFINYFDTPEERRKGRGVQANFMGKVMKDYKQRIEAIKNTIPNKYVNLQELNLNQNENTQ